MGSVAYGDIGHFAQLCGHWLSIGGILMRSVIDRLKIYVEKNVKRGEKIFVTVTLTNGHKFEGYINPDYDELSIKLLQIQAAIQFTLPFRISFPFSADPVEFQLTRTDTVGIQVNVVGGVGLGVLLAHAQVKEEGA
jgi:sRNA-binding regulator protein Hfq